MTPQEKIDKKKNDTNNRQKAYYQRNKDDIKKMKQDERDMIKQMKLKNAPRDVLVDYPIDKIIEIFKKFIQNDKTITKYTANIKMIFRLCSIDKFVADDITYDLINDKIANSTYSLSTKKSAIQSVLVFLTHSQMKINDILKKKYADLHVMKRKIKQQMKITQLCHTTNTCTRLQKNMDHLTKQHS
jgi:hypothetical protein